MHGVGPSTVLGGRYAVQRRLAQLPGAERWSAHDATLERDVVVVCFAADHPNADATLDAARRAAGVDNERLVRVLDVGRSSDVAFFVEEALREARTLTHLLEQGGLPSEEARRVAGEAATGLEAARARGLHHLRLNPSYVLRAGDGTVKVSGLATAAALAGVDDMDAADAARTDAVGVVAVTYAALTSRWPLAAPVPGLEPAPHLAGGVPAPSEIAAGVPGDLDALCRLTLNDDEGPLTPGDFATQIAPWSRGLVSGLGSTSQQTATGDLADDTDVDRTLALQLPGGAAPGGSSVATPGGSSVATSGGSSVAAPVGVRHEDGSGHAGSTQAAHAGAGHAVPGAAVAGAVGTALGTAGHAAGHAAGKVGSFARAAADKAADKAAEKAAEKRAARAAAAERAQRDRVYLDDALLTADEDIEPPLPMLPPETAAAPSRNQAKIVVAIMAAFLVVATVIGFWGVSQIGSDAKLDLSGSAPQPTVTVTGAPTTVAPSTTAPPTTSTATGTPLAILKATGFDPQGDGKERNGEAPRVYDGDPSSFWTSEGYASSDFGGLKKGVGVLLDLGQPAKLTEVMLALPDVADVTVYLSDEDSVDGAVEVGSSLGQKGRVTITSKDTQASGKYVIVWFTRVSQVGDGRFRATLAEVSLR